MKSQVHWLLLIQRLNPLDLHALINEQLHLLTPKLINELKLRAFLVLDVYPVQSKQ